MEISSQLRDIFSSDVLCVSSITRTSPQSMTLSDLYKINNPDGFVITGGPDPTFKTEEWLRHVDVVVRGEREATLKDLINRLTEDPFYLKDISGISYNKNGNPEFTNPRPLLTEAELGQLPHPFYDPEVSRKIHTGTIETNRDAPIIVIFVRSLLCMEMNLEESPQDGFWKNSEGLMV